MVKDGTLPNNTKEMVCLGTEILRNITIVTHAWYKKKKGRHFCLQVLARKLLISQSINKGTFSASVLLKSCK